MKDENTTDPAVGQNQDTQPVNTPGAYETETPVNTAESQNIGTAQPLKPTVENTQNTFVEPPAVNEDAVLPQEVQQVPETYIQDQPQQIAPQEYTPPRRFILAKLMLIPFILLLLASLAFGAYTYFQN
jgi:hypothetical protein